MRLLITRPEPDASNTAERLRALGHETMVQPLLTIAFVPSPPDLPTPAAILITSQNAVRALGAWPQAKDWLRVPVFAAGPATARAIAALGFVDIRGGARDSASLEDRVLEDLPPGGGPLIYPAARDRAGALEENLTGRGYDVRLVEAYRAIPATRLDETVRAAIAGGQLDGVLLYSRRTATTFRDLVVAAGLTDKIARLAFYVVSEQIAEVLAAIPARFHVANHPDEDSLFRLIPASG
jgi:uroporphyrinogen-III synthase